MKDGRIDKIEDWLRGDEDVFLGSRAKVAFSDFIRDPEWFSAVSQVVRRTKRPTRAVFGRRAAARTGSGASHRGTSTPHS